MGIQDQFVVGQRWQSLMEPDLGIGLITNVGTRQLELQFSNAQRCYSIEGAPLRRLPLRPGDRIGSAMINNLRIETITEENGLRFCHTGGQVTSESDIVSINSAHPEVEDALFHAQFDLPPSGQLRIDSLYASFHARQSAAKGWAGPRVQLIAHQLSTASTITHNIPGRFWLADEVGLGKTVTAGLALHQLLLAERLERVLILVPDALLIQWFIELYRKFNLAFSLINDYFSEDSPPDEFWATHELCLSSYEFVAASDALQSSLLGAGWDLLVVDEAHHLAQFPVYTSFYLPLISQASSVFFLSAIVDALPKELLGDKGHVFRSTREQIPLFPKRKAHLAPIEDVSAITNLKDEFLADEGLQSPPPKYRFIDDPRLDWLIVLLRELKGEKVLLIAHTRAKAVAIAEALRLKASLNTALFHEGMTLVARDRMAAYFADNDDVRLLICSEIGSEGRNFQFCHHLVFFDYPISLDLLEQRIGRIDRIGQTSTIHLHMPSVKGSPQDRLVRWLNESIGLFDAPARVGDVFMSGFREQLVDMLQQADEASFEDFIKTSCQLRQQAIQRTKSNVAPPVSNRTDGGRLLRSIRREDASPRLAMWLEAVMEHFGVDVEEIAPQTWNFITDHSLFDGLSGADELRHPFTFSRETALRREDYIFLTWDHPLTQNAMMLVRSESNGLCSAAFWPDKTRSRSTLYLEAIYVLDCPKEPLHAFPIRVLVNERGDVQRIACTTLKKNLQEGSADMFRRLVATQQPLLRNLLEKTKAVATAKQHKLASESILCLTVVRLVIRG